MSNLRFKYTILYVESVAETLEFYESAFGFKRKMLHQSGDYGELETGATTIAFSARKLMSEIGKNPGRPNAANPTFEIAFETGDVALALNRALAADATLVQGAKDMPWGQTTAYVSDNNGFLIELCTPVTAAS